MLDIELATPDAYRARHASMARILAFSGILSSGILIAASWSIVPAHADPCTNTTDSANGTICNAGSTEATLTPVSSNPAYSDGDFDLILNNHDVNGDTNGITLDNVTAGSALFIGLNQDSDVRGNNGTGIQVGLGAVDTTIEVNGTSSVSGSVSGIDVSPIISGTEADPADITIRTQAETTVSAPLLWAIFAFVRREFGDITIDAQGTVQGGLDAISAGYSAEGAFGNILITTGTKPITGGRDGISAGTFIGTTTITTGTGAVTGGEHGINAFGDTTTVTTAGNVTGGLAGILANSDGNIMVTTAANTWISGTGALSDGIKAGADGAVTINNNAHVQGVGEGLDVTSAAGATLNNTGLITAGSLRAITVMGAASVINNSGTVLGLVDLTEGNDLFNNEAGGVFEARGSSLFNAGTDVFNNNGGVVRSAGDPGVGELVSFNGLERFNNTGGVISLVDGGNTIDDFVLQNATAYVGDNGRVAVDAFLASEADGGKSDLITINGTTEGKTFVSVNLTNPIGSAPNVEGIPVIVENGAADEEEFDLAGGVLNAGFFAWDLRADGNIHELFTTGPGAGAYEFAAGITGAQEVWQQTSGTLLERQADLRALLQGTGVTPVADFSAPVEPTPLARVTPGFWFKGVGAYIDRDDEENGFTLDRRQTIWGGIAGFDFGTQDVGDALMFGVFAGYLTSDLNFRSTDTEWNYEGPTVGAYVTYLDRGLYLDATVKADFLAIDIDPEDLAPLADDADTDATTIGGRIDAGYKFGQVFFIEPQASLAVVHTEIDDVDIFGGTVEFDDETDIRGRLGLRLGHDYTASDGIVYSGDVTASVWEDFSGDNDVTIVDSGFPDFGAADDSGQTTGDVALGFSVLAPDGWSGFLRANYLFADDYEAIAGNAGLRYAW